MISRSPEIYISTQHKSKLKAKKLLKIMKIKCTYEQQLECDKNVLGYRLN